MYLINEFNFTEGIYEDKDKMKEAFGIDNIEEMANLKYFKRAKILYEEAKGK